MRPPDRQKYVHLFKHSIDIGLHDRQNDTTISCSPCCACCCAIKKYCQCFCPCIDVLVTSSPTILQHAYATTAVVS